MKMTVGELVARQLKEEKSSVTFPEGTLPVGAKEALKSLADMKEKIEKPLLKQLETVKSVYGNIAPQLERISEMNRVVEGNYMIPERRIQNVRIVNTEDIGFGSNKKEKTVVVASYILPKKATWESLSIQFLDGHLVKVSYPGMKSQKFDYKDMGFMNTKTNKPDLKWTLLQVIAQHGGALTKSNWNKKFGRNVKYELNEGLKKFFGMDSNPIPHYTKKNGYQPLFLLKAEI
jgi:hypothetical protein